MSQMSFFDTDKHALDEEWVAHPKNVRQYSRLLAKANKSAKEADAAYDVVLAEVSLEVKSNYQHFGLSKAPSETMAKQVATTDKRVKKARQAYIDAEFQRDNLKADVDALSHKKSGLQDLVVLWLQDYFADPRISGENNEEAREKMARIAQRKEMGRGRVVIPKKKKKSDD